MARSTAAETAEAYDTSNLTADEAVALLANNGMPTTIVRSEPELDDKGFERIFEKEQLIGRSFTIISWELLFGERSEYAHIRIVMNKKPYCFRDGSTGIFEQLKALADKNVSSMILCPRGLRVSKYTGPNGDPAETYYINDSNRV